MNMPFTKITCLVLLLGHIAATSACETVTTWNAFVNKAHSAMSEGMDTMCFNSFRITKPADQRLLLNRPISIQCGPTGAPGSCIIEGAGTQIRIAGARAEVSITGFTFTGATECAIWVNPTSSKTHLIDDCVFTDNHGDSSTWRGGAIKTEAGTSMTLSGCRFEKNTAAAGGAVFHKGKTLNIIHSIFRDNLAMDGGAVGVETGSGLDIFDTTFVGNRATASQGGAVEVRGTGALKYDVTSVAISNSPCNGIFDRVAGVCIKLSSDHPTSAPTLAPTMAPALAPIMPPSTFVMGDLTVNSLGLKLSTGLKAKILARAGNRLDFTSPQRSRAKSVLTMHTNPDGAATFPLDDGGWIYMSNAENMNGEGGVYGIEFDSNGEVRDYVSRLTGTTRNCAGGKTPWGTWVSCEEFGRGMCWQVDPLGERPSVKTKLTEGGGNFESMAYDLSDPDAPRFYVTEDHVRGAIRRFTPLCTNIELSWNLLQVNGEIDYLEFLPNNRFRWTSSLDEGRDSAEDFFQFVEGISFHGGTLSFVSKRQKEVFHLDLESGTYIVIGTDQGTLEGGGTFGAGPDQILQKGDTLYFTEDGGGNPGVYAHVGDTFLTVFEGRDSAFVGDETTGLSFSPDGKRMYVCMQEIGYLFEITRDDGQAFPGQQRVSTLRHHDAHIPSE